jgi:hypothetical protein
MPNTPNHYVYDICTADGHEDTIYEAVYTSATSVEMDDRLWGEDSGWATVRCDQCGHLYRERTFIGHVIYCPMCDAPVEIPVGAYLEEYNE